MEHQEPYIKNVGIAMRIPDTGLLTAVEAAEVWIEMLNASTNGTEAEKAEFAGKIRAAASITRMPTDRAMFITATNAIKAAMRGGR